MIEKLCFKYHGVSLYPYPTCYVNTRSFWGQTSWRWLSKKGKKGGGSNQGAGRGHGSGRGGKKKDAYNTPNQSQGWHGMRIHVKRGVWGRGWGATESIRPAVNSGHLGPICPSNSDLVRGYRIQFTRRPSVTMEP